MSATKTLIAAALLVVPAAAQAATIDFEAQAGANPPQFITPGVAAQPVTIDGATFAGGRIVKGTDDFLDPDVGDLTAAYTTMPYAGFTNPITIAFAGAISAISFEIVNNIAGDYQVTTNTGLSQSYSFGAYANQYVSLAGLGINAVSIRYTTPSQSPLFDFAIDNVTTTAAVAAVPELATWMMMIAGLGLTGVALRRRRETVAACRA